jgi:hypothetical protein
MTLLVIVLCLSGQACHGHEVAFWPDLALEQCQAEIDRHELGDLAYCEIHEQEHPQ